MPAVSVVSVNAAGLVLIGFVTWWFWLSRPAARHVDSAITIVVANGVFLPARIEVARGRPIVLRFLRKDPSPCAAKVTFSELGLSADLIIDAEKELQFEPLHAGEYKFSCEMNMYRGYLLVK